MSLRYLKIDSDYNTYATYSMKRPVLLWENDAPTSEFGTSSFVVNANASNYPFFILEYGFQNTTDTNHEFIFGGLGEVIEMQASTIGLDSSHGGTLTSSHLYRRTFNLPTSTSTSASAANCYRVGNTSTAYNEHLIPLKIYGLTNLF